MDNCILSGPFAGRTRILVTHALHVLDKTDYIYVMDNGIIIEEGTHDVRGSLMYGRYGRLTSIVFRQALVKDSVVFSHLVDEYGSHEKVEGKVVRRNSRKGSIHPDDADSSNEMKFDATLIQAEERVTGSVSWTTYVKYFRFAGSVFWVPIIIALVLLSQTASGVFMKEDHERTHLTFSI